MLPWTDKLGQMICGLDMRDDNEGSTLEMTWSFLYLFSLPLRVPIKTFIPYTHPHFQIPLLPPKLVLLPAQAPDNDINVQIIAQWVIDLPYSSYSQDPEPSPSPSSAPPSPSKLTGNFPIHFVTDFPQGWRPLVTWPCCYTLYNFYSWLAVFVSFSIIILKHIWHTLDPQVAPEILN